MASQVSLSWFFAMTPVQVVFLKLQPVAFHAKALREAPIKI
ncbi:hypothetical protein [Pseudovibrio sp. SPO723]|nr:hypothetical protein [Pseudovibrio sp. SPO723]MDX5593307.1 hypothetical protein [Pseudovibrio sp. SPO723]